MKFALRINLSAPTAAVFPTRGLAMERTIAGTTVTKMSNPFVKVRVFAGISVLS